MKRIILATLLATTLATAGLQPDQFTFTWTRQGTTAIADSNTWLSGVTYLLTNCVCSNALVTQDLTGCGIIIRVGDSTTNLAFTGTVQNTNGLFCCYFTIPQTTASTIIYTPTGPVNVSGTTNITGIQLTITNGAVIVTDKEIKQLKYMAPLH